jgi:dipeptidyl aminopeptidase/acylaminoacyl peptidase
VRFLHGSEDDVIRFEKIYDVAVALQSKYSGTDISIELLKGGDHRLSREEDISAILDTLDELL